MLWELKESMRLFFEAPETICKKCGQEIIYNFMLKMLFI